MNEKDNFVNWNVESIDASQVEAEVLVGVKTSKQQQLNHKLEEIQHSIDDIKTQIKKLSKNILHAKQQSQQQQQKQKQFNNNFYPNIQHWIVEQNELSKKLSELLNERSKIESQMKILEETIETHYPKELKVNDHNDDNDDDGVDDNENNDDDNYDNDNDNNNDNNDGEDIMLNELDKNTSQSINTWDCQKCSLTNDQKHLRCQVCGARKPRQKGYNQASLREHRKRKRKEKDEDEEEEEDQKKEEIWSVNKKRKVQQSTNQDTVDEKITSKFDISSIKDKQNFLSPSIVKYPIPHCYDDADDDTFEQRLQAFTALKEAFDHIRKGGQGSVKVDTDIPLSFYDDSLGLKILQTYNEEKENDNHNHNHLSIFQNHSQYSKKQRKKKDCIIPTWMYRQLLKFQRKGVIWLWNLYHNEVGGLLGDEMGLGKTVQVIAFLECLRIAQIGGPVLIVCPATVLQQWMHELHKWAPLFRIMLLHESGGHACTEEELICKLHDSCTIPNSDKPTAEFCGGVLITTYNTLRLKEDLLLPVEWGLVILDEGHKIRNPDAQITLICKQLLTRHRLILTGAPLQNSLKDLWSLFDFIFPGRLGTLPIFEQEFVTPIRLGGYNNATRAQIEQAISCANALKEIIDPLILRRFKNDVKKHLHISEKTEQVLFCKLSFQQIIEYKAVLSSPDMALIRDNNTFLERKRKGAIFKTISTLKKICNHPDLLYREYEISPKKKSHTSAISMKESKRPKDYGNIERSGKLQVLNEMLKQWHNTSHKALLFCQTRQFLNIVELLVRDNGYEYRRLDGSTPVGMRQKLINEFNENKDIFLMLITTKAGGLGINLTGADRVVLIDPDWNPSTDAQARERAYRIGQNKNVIIYRLICKGTIEEKIYHRQIFKQFLTDKILKDPNHQRLFNEEDLKNLFSLDHFDTSSMTNRSNHITTITPTTNENSSNSMNYRKKLFGSKMSNTDLIFSHLQDAFIGSEDLCRNDDEKTIQKENNSSNNNKTNNNENENEKTEDKKLLECLFNTNAMVSSAFRHDYVENIDAIEKQQMMEEAERVAQQALTKLEQIREEIQKQPINIPTWTGRSGNPIDITNNYDPHRGVENTIISPMRIFGKDENSLIHIIRKAHLNENSQENVTTTEMSSKNILAKIKERKATTTTTTTNGNRGLLQLRYERLVKDLYEFMKSETKSKKNNGGIETSEIIAHFQNRLTNETEQYMFRIILQNLCRLVSIKGSRKKKGWILKQKFMDLN